MPDGICPFAQWVGGVRTQNSGGQLRVGFCDHTAGGFYTTMLNPDFWNPRETSVHFAISREGKVAQFVNIFDTAWAQGRDARGLEVSRSSPGVTWTPFATQGWQNPNLYLISTEHEDYVRVNGVSRAVPGSQWTEEQYAADLKVKRWCREEIKRVQGGYDIMGYGIDALASHYMFDPVNRVYCAGSYWQNEYRARLFNDLMGDPTLLMVPGFSGEKMVGNFLVKYVNGLPVYRTGSTDGTAQGRVSRRRGDKWYWDRTNPANGTFYQSPEEGD